MLQGMRVLRDLFSLDTVGAGNVGVRRRAGTHHDPLFKQFINCESFIGTDVGLDESKSCLDVNEQGE